MSRSADAEPARRDADAAEADAAAGARADHPLVAQADRFAEAAHAGQRRRGGARQPYIVHPRAVLALVKTETDDPAAQAAALLHDVVEDSAVGLDRIAAVFGDDVAAIVAWLTDPAEWAALETAERKRAQAAKLRGAPAAAKIIKIADQLDNLDGRRRDLAAWPSERHRAYLRGARSVVDACRDAAPALAARFDASADALQTRLSAPP